MAAMAPALTTEAVAHPSRPVAASGDEGLAAPVTNGHSTPGSGGVGGPAPCSLLLDGKHAAAIRSAKNLVGRPAFATMPKTKLHQPLSGTPSSSVVGSMPSGGGGDGRHVNGGVAAPPPKLVLPLNGRTPNPCLPRVNGSRLMTVSTLTTAASSTLTTAASSLPSVVTSSSLPSGVAASTQHDGSTRLRRQHSDLEARSALLLRRLRRLQSRQATSHVRRQLSGFVSQRRGAVPDPPAAPSTSAAAAGVDLHSELLQSRDVKQLSTAALVSLVHKLQSSQPLTLRQHLSGSGADHQAAPPAAPAGGQLGADVCGELKRAGGQLQANLDHLLAAYDSDATESSSGGESDSDELHCASSHDKQTKPDPRPCVEWTWSRQRSAVASRWTWLQAQVSDLEYRIRQHNDIYRQIRLAKGAVVLGAPAPPRHQAAAPADCSPSPCSVARVLHNVDRQSTRLSRQLGNAFSPADDAAAAVGHCGTPPAGGSPDDGRTDGATAARCRPLRSHRRRRLLRSAGVCQLSRKAARLTTVACHCCHRAAPPCVMCGGRYNNVRAAADAAPMTALERVALLDPAFHPVLSFKHDIPLSLHFESLLKSGGWQDRSVVKPARPPANKKRTKLVKEHVRKYTRRTTATALSSAKIRNKYEQKQLSRGAALPAAVGNGVHDAKILCRSSDLRKRKATLHAIGAIRKKSRLVLPSASSRPLGRPAWARQGSLGGSTAQRWWADPRRRRRGESAFDINNIVIPYSIASSTRVEKLRYKEIITPKWREVTTFSASPAGGTVDPGAGVTPSDGGVTPSNGGITPSDGGVAPSDGGIVPSDGGVVPPDGGVAPSDGGVAPSDGPVTALAESVQRGDVDSAAPKLNDEEMAELAEDTDDGVITARHLRCELHEKKRFVSYLKCQKKRPPSVIAAPRASSPHPSASSSSTDVLPVTPPATPAPPDDLLLEVGEGRPRSGSVTLAAAADGCSPPGCRSRSLSETRASSPVGTGVAPRAVSPWTARRFPLAAVDLAQLAASVRPVAATRAASVRPAAAPADGAYPYDDTTPPSESTGASPAPSSSNSSLLDEDPDDPEWTVVAHQRPPPTPSSLVLKLSKR